MAKLEPCEVSELEREFAYHARLDMEAELKREFESGEAMEQRGWQMHEKDYMDSVLKGVRHAND